MPRTMKTREMFKLLKKDGWYLFDVNGSHYQFLHPIKKGKVSVPFHGMNIDLASEIVGNILKQAGLDKGAR